MVVLWHVKRFSDKLPHATQLSVFQQAFQQWDDASRLNFSYTVNETAAHIKISFLKGKLRVSSNYCGKSLAMDGNIVFPARNVSQFTNSKNFIGAERKCAFQEAISTKSLPRNLGWLLCLPTYFQHKKHGFLTT